MSFGLRVWNSGGHNTVDTNSRVGRVLGFVNVSSNGSLNVPEFSQGTPFYHCQATSLSSIGSYPVAYGPDVSISGTTISWSWPTANVSGTVIVFGVY